MVGASEPQDGCKPITRLAPRVPWVGKRAERATPARTMCRNGGFHPPDRPHRTCPILAHIWKARVRILRTTPAAARCV